jgi:protein-S-isoprenylcysteine O-methyltransferase Ste14
MAASFIGKGRVSRCDPDVKAAPRRRLDQRLVSIKPTLVTNGIYSVIRNPSYLGLLVSMLGWALAFRSGVGVLLVALILPPLVARIRAEERLLRTQFGGEYDAYCARTWRLIPALY